MNLRPDRKFVPSEPTIDELAQQSAERDMGADTESEPNAIQLREKAKKKAAAEENRLRHCAGGLPDERSCLISAWKSGRLQRGARSVLASSVSVFRNPAANICFRRSVTRSGSASASGSFGTGPGIPRASAASPHSNLSLVLSAAVLPARSAPRDSHRL